MTRIVPTSLRPTRPVLIACAAFGIATRHTRSTRRADEHQLRTIAQLDATLPPGGITLITGPSGAGKSTLLRLWRATLRARGTHAVELVRTFNAESSVIDSLRGPIRQRLALLAAAGLADATLLPRRASELSEGQRFRLHLARAMQRARRTGPVPTLFIDEFAACLDRTTARSVAVTLARGIRREKHTRLVVATAHDDVLEWLRPDALLWVPIDGPCVCRWAGEYHTRQSTH